MQMAHIQPRINIICGHECGTRQVSVTTQCHSVACTGVAAPQWLTETTETQTELACLSKTLQAIQFLHSEDKVVGLRRTVTYD